MRCYTERDEEEGKGALFNTERRWAREGIGQGRVKRKEWMKLRK